MSNEIDILENELRDKYPKVLEILLKDHTTQKNIFWATENYQDLGEGYESLSPIKTELISGENGNVIMPRVKKEKELQQSRSRDMAEVFTPSWLCNAMNNLVDNAWFGRENVFNIEKIDSNGKNTWESIPNKIEFPEGETWFTYMKRVVLEITCGEAPYITSRYDTTTGLFIPIENRIGMLDRKLRVINENVDNTGEWLEAAQNAYKSTYAFEWQGDSLLLARESMLYSFIENYIYKFGKQPLLKSIQYIAYIIAWNVWQMDGLKGVIPKSCKDTIVEKKSMFDEISFETFPCEGCQKDNIFKHNGIYCLIKEWKSKDPDSGKKGRKIKFVDILQGQN